MPDERSLVVVLALAMGLAITADFVVQAETAVAVDCPTETNRDKSGTRGGQLNFNGSQVQTEAALASRCSLDAERGGFEPPVRISPYTGLAIRPNRPLWHLSEACFFELLCFLAFGGLLTRHPPDWIH